MNLLIIGIGNSLRGDDGAGPRAAAWLHDALSRSGVASRVIIVQQLGPELAEELAAPDVASVLFVDACVDAAHVQLRPLNRDAERGPISAGSHRGPVSHHVAPEAIVALAAALYGAMPRCAALALPARDFHYGERLSVTARQALATARARAREIADALDGACAPRVFLLEPDAVECD